MRSTLAAWESPWASSAGTYREASCASDVTTADGSLAGSASIAVRDLDLMAASAASWASVSPRGWDRGADNASDFRCSRVWA
jgi:2-succinyl-5-enolpyruvyl-6-hydroxy-3-cyclohexene-1-carboxylate synthase